MKLKQLFRTLLLFFGLFASLSLFGQEKLLDPTVMSYDLEKDIPSYVCPHFDISKMLAEDERDVKAGVSPARFAKKFEVNLTPSNSGKWEKKEGLNVWRLSIESEKAYSMMLIFDQLQLTENSSLFIYDEKMTYILGPYTSTYNEQGVLATPLVPGSKIIVELVYEEEERTKAPSFVIESISHDYWNAFGPLNGLGEDGHAQSILECHNDINCPVGAPWQIEKLAVARIVTDGRGLCTGALVNNTRSDKTPYFLTADHCLNTNREAGRSVFYFNYESPTCGGGDGQNHHTVSGAVVRANNANSDFSLLQLNARVPTSYQPFYAGWDRRDVIPDQAHVIHHPRGNVKKISFDNDPLAVNTTTQTLTVSGPNIVLVPGTAWDVDLDDGTTEGGSSGAPLFNTRGRIIGQNSGGTAGCPGEGGVQKWYGRFFSSWNTGAMNQRLSDWLAPVSNTRTIMWGFAPQGWIHDWVIEWNAPTHQNVHSGVKTLDVGNGNQTFYRGTDNKMHTFYWNSTNGWVHDWINGWNAPSNQNIGGDVVAGEGNQLFYRGSDSKMHTYYWSNNDWHHDWLGGWNAPSNQNVKSTQGSITVGQGNQVFYRGNDNKMHIYYWSSANGWTHDWINGWNAPSNENIAGDVVVGNGNQIFYRGVDGKMQNYYWSNNDWHHGWPGGWNAPSSSNINSAAGSLAIGENNQLFYRGTDNKMHTYYWTSANGWVHDWVNGWNAPSSENVSGDIAVGEGNQVFYRGADGKMHVYYWNSTNGWTHDWLEASWQAPTIHNVSGVIEVGENNQIFYRGTDGRCRTYYWTTGFFRGADNSGNYTMNETAPSPTIPQNNQKNSIDFKIAPNPVISEFTLEISSEQQEEVQISLYDITGKMIWTKKEMVNSGYHMTSFSMDGLSAGMYIVRINGAKETQIAKSLVKI